MPLDFIGTDALQARGAVSYAKGASAEEQVKRAYERAGAVCIEQRWRGRAGEIDLIFLQDDEVIMVEVKSSKTHMRAAELLRPRQMQRLCVAAEEFLGTQPRGGLTPMRLDVALVDGQGRMDILENALMMV